MQKLHTDFMEFYNNGGLNDDEIAERLDVNYHQARYLRLKYNLESNSAKRLEEKIQKGNEILQARFIGQEDTKG